MRIWKTKGIACLLAYFLLSLAQEALHAQTSSIDRALRQSLQATPAIALVLDIKTGQVLAVVRPREAAAMRSAPGSVLKPFFLADALQQRLIQPHSTIFCRRSLTIAGRNVACTHPQHEAAFDAEQALAYSCNRYFAELAKQFSPEQAVDALRQYGLTEPAHLFPAEASSIVRTPATTEQRELFVLGLEGLLVTPAQLAVAYRKLALQMRSLPSGPPLLTVELGLEDSVQYGMADNTHVRGLAIAGKTGTASDPRQPWTHGWFAGFAPAESPRIAIAIYLPHGSGADAAHLAQSFFRACKEMLLP